MDFRDLLVGNIDLDAQGQAYLDFYRQGAKIRQLLGDRAYLVDGFIEKYLNGIELSLDDCPSADGRDASGRLERGNLIAPDDPRITKYYEDSTQSLLRMGAGVNSYLSEAAKVFKDDLGSLLFRRIDTVLLKEMYSDICKMIGSETEMKKLLELLQLRFQPVTAIQSFWQGSASQLVHDMLQRDMQTNRCMFKLLMDDLSLLE